MPTATESDINYNDCGGDDVDDDYLHTLEELLSMTLPTQNTINANPSTEITLCDGLAFNEGEHSVSNRRSASDEGSGGSQGQCTSSYLLRSGYLFNPLL